MTKLYGVDLGGEITPLMVRDAIVECFFQAHCADSGIGAKDSDINRQYCHDIVKKSFSDVGGDFDQPTKQDLLYVVDNLKSFAAGFRDPSIINKHHEEIVSLLGRVK